MKRVPELTLLCASPLSSVSDLSLVFYLLPLPVLPSEHRLVAFSSAIREWGGGSHQQGRGRLSGTRRLSGVGLEEKMDFLLIVTFWGRVSFGDILLGDVLLCPDPADGPP